MQFSWVMVSVGFSVFGDGPILKVLEINVSSTVLWNAIPLLHKATGVNFKD